jgi:aldehyde dehydrogenase (NAD+)
MQRTDPAVVFVIYSLGKTQENQGYNRLDANLCALIDANHGTSAVAKSKQGSQNNHMDTYRNFIGGKWIESSSSRTVNNTNPADTDDVIGKVRQATREEARAAVEAASEAFQSWRKTPAPARGRIVAKAARLMEEAKEELAQILTREEGKTLSESRGELQRSINVAEFCAGESRRMNGETILSELPANFAYTIKQPLGVVACVTPWNFPVAIPVWKIAPALVAGNTVVFKPATLTPATGVRIVEIFEAAGIPPGVLNLILGSGSDAGDEIINHPAVKAVSFTGSNEVGIRLYEQVSRRGAKCQCEMGGKNPVVILEDADMDLTVESTAQGAFGSSGQRCTATSRAIVINAMAATPGLRWAPALMRANSRLCSSI